MEMFSYHVDKTLNDLILKRLVKCEFYSHTEGVVHSISFTYSNPKIISIKM